MSPEAPAVPARGLATATPGDVDGRLVDGLRAGDEAAFVALLERYHPALVRLAAMYVPDRATAEDVVQETWIAVLKGIDRFEGRSAFKTWLYRILLNQARQRGKREARSVPFSALVRAGAEGDEAAVDPDRFFPPGHEDAGHWASPPREWGASAEERLLASETRDRIKAEIAALPPGQRAVIELRDVQGWTAPEVCHALGLSETNQRVLLHRARSKVRRALERYLDDEGAPDR